MNQCNQPGPRASDAYSITDVFTVYREGQRLPVRCRLPDGHDGVHAMFITWFDDQPLPLDEIPDVDYADVLGWQQ